VANACLPGTGVFEGADMDTDTWAGTAAIELHIGVDHTTVRKSQAGVPAGFIVLAIGSGTTAAKFFKHAPPTPLEMENAIQAVEDEVTRAGVLATPDGSLLTHDACIRELALRSGVVPGHSMHLPIDAVERQFDLLAALTQGRPATSAGIPTDIGFAATLLILREFMHHLQFSAITITSP
jgi:exopolyphosphatase/pppGpp-phosphohydrolase